MSDETDIITDGKVSSGVAELIEKLRNDGVEEGKKNAAEIIKNAEDDAEKILQEAKSKAENILADAEQNAQRLRKGGEDALKIAMRDIVLELKAKLSETVSERVHQLISTELAQEDFLKELILVVASRARVESGLDDAGKSVVLLPKDLIGLEELRQHPLELEEGSLSHFILHVASEVLREGVSFGSAEDGKHGLRIHLVDKDIQIDLSDERIAEVLLDHLQPRFRAILEGMVK